MIIGLHFPLYGEIQANSEAENPMESSKIERITPLVSEVGLLELVTASSQHLNHAVKVFEGRILNRDLPFALAIANLHP